MVAGVALITVVSACGSNGSGSAQSATAQADEQGRETSEPVEATVDLASAVRIAAEETADQGWFMTTMSVSGVPGSELSMTYQGSTDGLNGLMTTDAGGVGLGGATFEARIVDGVFYLKFPDFGADTDAASSAWIELDPGADGANPFTDATGFGVDSLTRMFDALQDASDDVEELGTEDIDGVSTTHYRLTISGDSWIGPHDDDPTAQIPEGFENALGQDIVVEVWVDDDGLIRRMRSVIDLGGSTDEAGTDLGPLTLTWEITELGEPVDVHAPPPDEIKSFTDMFGSVFDDLGFDSEALGQAPDELRDLMEGFDTGGGGDLEQQIEQYGQDLDQFGAEVEKELQDLFGD
jgi:hypothetical protein